MSQIYRSGKDIYDAQTNQRISSPEVLARDYKWAVEVNWPTGSTQNVSNSTPIIRPWQYWMSDWKWYQALKDAAAEIIKIRQWANKDIIDPTSYWKGQQRNASDLSDPRLKELSPADQASLRLSKQWTASAALYALDQERAYREKVGGSVMDNITKMYENQSKEKESEANRKYREDQLAIDRYNSGMWDPYNTTPESTPENKEWGSLSWRNNNSWNIKFSEWQKEFWAVKDPNSAFAKFPNEESARNAYKALLTSPTGIYKWLDNNSAMLEWSSDYKWDPKAYNYDKLVALWAPAVSKNFANFTDREWQQFFEAQKKAEWWKEWTSTTTTVPTTQQGVVNATRKASIETETSSEFFADSIDGKKVWFIDWLSRDELVVLFDLISGWLTPEEKSKLFKLWITQATLDAATNLVTPSSSTKWTRAWIKV